MGNNKGQASLEGLLVLPIGILCVGLLFWTVGLGWSYFWSRYQLYEAVVCLQDQAIEPCEFRFRKQMRSVVPYVQIESLDLQKSRHYQKGHLRLQVSFLGPHKIQMQKLIRL